MKPRLLSRIYWLFTVALVMATLSCQVSINMPFIPMSAITSTMTSMPTMTPTPMPTSTPTVTVTPLTTYNAAGVRMCYYISGVSVPAQMPADVVASPTPYLYPTPTLPPVTKVDTSTTARQLKIFDELWQDVNDNYIYADFNGHDWKAIGNRYRVLIQQGLSDQDFYTTMKDMIFELGDEHSSFLSPADVMADEETLAGKNNYVGIGAMVSAIGDPNSAVILYVYPNSPADLAGLRPHDKIIAVDGGPLLDETGSPRTLGPTDTPVTITVQRLGEAPRDINLIRKPISSPTPINYCIVPNTHIGYIFLPTFYDETIPDQVRTALAKMTADGPLDGLIIDNRMNYGGSVGVVGQTLGFFTSGVQGHFVSRTSSYAFTITAEDVYGSQDVPLAILVDEDTASGGEIFSGILRVSQRAVIIGRNTFGNVEILYPYDFEDGSRAWIASATFEPVGEANGIWERTGIIPDYVVPTRWDLFTEANDPALAKAVEVLQGKK